MVVCSKISDKRTKAEVEYKYTGLNKAGNQMNINSLQRIFKYDLRDWQKSIEHYLQTGFVLEDYKE